MRGIMVHCKETKPAQQTYSPMFHLLRSLLVCLVLYLKNTSNECQDDESDQGMHARDAKSNSRGSELGGVDVQSHHPGSGPHVLIEHVVPPTHSFKKQIRAHRNKGTYVIA